MNKKLGIVIAVFLFLFLGTSTFVFANPSQEDIKGTGTIDDGTINPTNEEKENNIEDQDEHDDENIFTTEPEEQNSDINNIILEVGKRTAKKYIQTVLNSSNSGIYNNSSDNGDILNNDGSSTTNPDADADGDKNQEDNLVNKDETKIIDAEKAIENAKNDLTQENIDKAKDLIEQIIDETKKQELLDEIGKLQEQLNEENKIKAAEEAIEKAKNDLTQENIDKAKELVEQITDEAKKQELLDEIGKLQEQLNEENKIKAAEEAIENAKNDLTQENIDKAKELVEQITDEAKKQELLDEIDKLQEQLNEENKIKAAEEAIEKAKNDLTQENIDKAKDLVEQITDETKKQELLEKLNELQNSIDIKNLVNELNQMVINASNKEEIDAARDYKTNNQIIEKVNNLSDELLKNELSTTLNELSKILDDTSVPTVIGINDGDYVNTSVSIEVEDENEVKIYLNEEEVTKDQLKNITEDNVYNLVVMDESFNETSLKFTIDTVNPVINNVLNGETYNNPVTITVTNETEPVTVYLTKDGNIIEYTLGEELKENGIYTIYVEDKAKNKSETIIFTLDIIDITDTKPFEFKNGAFFNTSLISVANTEYSWMKVNNGNSKTGFIKEYTCPESGVFEIELYDNNKKYITTVTMVYSRTQTGSIFKNLMRSYILR